VTSLAFLASPGLGASVVAQTVLDGSLLLALPLALLAGLVAFASPCVLPLVPGYLAYVSGLAGPARAAAAPHASVPALGATAPGVTVPRVTVPRVTVPEAGSSTRTAVLADPSSVPTGRLVLGTSLFVAGFSVVFVGLGTVAGLAGAVLPQSRTVDVVAGLLAVLMGLVFVGAVPWLRTELRPTWRPAVGLAGAPLLGAAFGVGWVPCLGPTLAAVLGLAYTDGGAARGAVLAAAYCVGLGLPFVLVSLAYARGLRVLEPLRRHRRLVTNAGGVLLVTVGVLVLSGACDVMVEALRAPISRFPVLL